MEEPVEPEALPVGSLPVAQPVAAELRQHQALEAAWVMEPYGDAACAAEAAPELSLIHI